MNVSVCMSSYNGAHYIKEQIDSILNQLGTKDELIISDDGSTDSTVEIINSYADQRIRLFHHKKQKEQYKFNYTTRNIEFAIEKARKNLIFLADQDDVWFPNKMEIMKEKLKTHKLVISDCVVTDKNLDVINQSYFELTNSKKGIIKNLIKNSYLGCCMAFHRDLLISILPIPQGPIAHDIWIGLNAELYRSVFFIDTPTMLYRRHSEAVSPSAKKSPYSLKFKIYYRIAILVQLIKQALKIGFCRQRSRVGKEIKSTIN